MLAPDGYQLLAYLGHGGFGTVHLVKGSETGAQCAMKVIINNSEPEARSVTREAEILKGLHHPNVVGLIEAQRHDSTVYLILEYCEMKDLYQYLSNPDLATSGVSPRQAAYWLLDLAAGIHVSTVECIMMHIPAMNADIVLHRRVNHMNKVTAQ
jgi:serine/threonine protein kinase